MRNGATVVATLGVALCLLSACGTEPARSKDAIELAKHAITSSRQPRLSPTFDFGSGDIQLQAEWETEYLSNEERIRRQLQNTQGNVAITGWSTRRIDRQTYLAIYEVSINGDTTLYIFEVNLQGGIVRNVADNPVLKERYGYATYR